MATAVVADLDLAAERADQPASRLQPAGVATRWISRRPEQAARPDEHLAAWPASMRSTKRGCGAAHRRQALALSDGEVVGAARGRPAPRPSSSTISPAGPAPPRASTKRLVVAVGDEADLLRVGLVPVGQAAAAARAARTSVLVMSPSGNRTNGSSAGSHREQEVGLVLVAIDRPAQPHRRRRHRPVEPGVVPGGQRLGARPPGRTAPAARTSGVSLQRTQGLGVRPARWAATKSSITAAGEGLALVEHVVGESPAGRGGGPGVVDVARGAAAAADAGRGARGVVQLQRHADHLGAAARTAAPPRSTNRPRRTWRRRCGSATRRGHRTSGTLTPPPAPGQRPAATSARRGRPRRLGVAGAQAEAHRLAGPRRAAAPAPAAPATGARVPERAGGAAGHRHPLQIEPDHHQLARRALEADVDGRRAPGRSHRRGGGSRAVASSRASSRSRSPATCAARSARPCARQPAGLAEADDARARSRCPPAARAPGARPPAAAPAAGPGGSTAPPRPWGRPACGPTASARPPPAPARRWERGPRPGRRRCERTRPRGRARPPPAPPPGTGCRARGWPAPGSPAPASARSDVRQRLGGDPPLAVRRRPSGWPVGRCARRLPGRGQRAVHRGVLQPAGRRRWPCGALGRPARGWPGGRPRCRPR